MKRAEISPDRLISFFSRVFDSFFHTECSYTVANLAVLVVRLLAQYYLGSLRPAVLWLKVITAKD